MLAQEDVAHHRHLLSIDKRMVSVKETRSKGLGQPGTPAKDGVVVSRIVVRLPSSRQAGMADSPKTELHGGTAQTLPVH